MPKNAEPGLRQDDEGTWWHYFKDGRRVRAKDSQCERCGTTFWSWRNRPRKRFCSDACRQGEVARMLPYVQCEWCGTAFFLTEKGQRFCSHRCAALSMHASRPSTTNSPASLVNASNPRFSQDASGQWWYLAGARMFRTRAHVQTCPHCQRKFLKSVFNRGQRHCSRSCGLRAVYVAEPRKLRGENSPAWRGGRQMRRGYVWVWCPDHPSRANTAKAYVLEHRLVMEKHLGRYLEPHEHVHHKNGVRHDNRIENLELWTRPHPHGVRASDLP